MAMSIITVVFIFIVVWWLVFQMTLSVGVKTDATKAKKGHAKSAPLNPNLKKKMIFTSLISATITTLYFIALKMQWIVLN